METLKSIVLKFANDWSMNLASMIAYSLITAIFPILLAILSLAGLFLNLAGPSYLHDVAQTINRVTVAVQIDVGPLLTNLVQLTGPLAIISLLALIWLGSNLFATMENAFSIIFRIRGRDLIPQRIMAVGMVLLLAVLLPLSLVAASLVTAGSDQFSALLPKRIGNTLSIIGPLTSLAVLWLLFLAIYVIVPNFEVRFRQAWRGALVATILFGATQLLFPLYFKLFLAGNIRYGALPASLLAVIIYLWFFALITVIGAQVNAVIMGLKSTQYDLARTFELAYKQQDQHVDKKRITTPTRLKRLRALLTGGRRSQAERTRTMAREHGDSALSGQGSNQHRRTPGQQRRHDTHGEEERQDVEQSQRMVAPTAAHEPQAALHGAVAVDADLPAHEDQNSSAQQQRKGARPAGRVRQLRQESVDPQHERGEQSDGQERADTHGHNDQ